VTRADSRASTRQYIASPSRLAFPTARCASTSRGRQSCTGMHRSLTALTIVHSSAQRNRRVGPQDSWHVRLYRYVSVRITCLTLGHVLNEFVREAAMPYLENDSPEVRKEAVLASTQLLVNDPICGQTSSHSVEIVSDVLGKLLTVGITDECKS